MGVNRTQQLRVTSLRGADGFDGTRANLVRETDGAVEADQCDGGSVHFKLLRVGIISYDAYEEASALTLILLKPFLEVKLYGP